MPRPTPFHRSPRDDSSTEPASILDATRSLLLGHTNRHALAVGAAVLIVYRVRRVVDDTTEVNP